LAQRHQRFGAAYIIDILRGARTERVLSAGHDALSVYGIGKHRGVNEWRNLARALLHQGLIDEAQDGYSVLSLNALSWPVLRGERPVSIARLVKPARRSKDGTRASSTNDSLFERLRTLRKRLADENGLPPYVIFHDSTLREMAEHMPLDLDQFAVIGQLFPSAVRVQERVPRRLLHALLRLEVQLLDHGNERRQAGPGSHHEDVLEPRCALGKREVADDPLDVGETLVGVFLHAAEE